VVIIRITIDLDSHSKLRLALILLRGFATLHKFPDEIRKTNRGRHIIWRGIKCTVEEMYLYRKIIGDDKRRIKLDILKKKGEKQILFKEKTASFFAFDGEGNRYLINQKKYPKDINLGGQYEINEKTN